VEDTDMQSVPTLRK